MKLYSIQASNNCRRVIATIRHLGLDVEITETTFGELKEPDYLAFNPNAKVPTLVDGDFVLWESRAIMQYLASMKPETTLWPNDERRRADIARWQFWDAAHLCRGTIPFAVENLFKKLFFKQGPDPAALAVGAKELRAFAPVLDTQLATRKWILGDELTLADFSVGGTFSFAEASGLPWDGYTHIKAWWARLNELPAWSSTAPKLG